MPEKHLRETFGQFATGVVVLTVLEPGTGVPIGLTANSFVSVSLEPPLVSVCISRDSTSWPRMRLAPRQAISILSAGQIRACRQLAARGGDRFKDLRLVRSPSGAPVLHGALAWLDCGIRREYVEGDHVVVIMEVRDHGRLHSGDRPLVFFGGQYGSFWPSDGVGDSGGGGRDTPSARPVLPAPASRR